MPRRMSCSMTVDPVRDRSKRVTRRHPDTWRDLKPGDRVTLIEKGMGLPKGSRQVVLAEVEIVDVRVESIAAVLDEPDACAREGLPQMAPVDFIVMWMRSHGYARLVTVGLLRRGGRFIGLAPHCRRIEWRYLDDEDDDHG